MPTIDLLIVVFSAKIAHYELPAFRGAMAGKVGHQHLLFHNHKVEGGLRYAYPLIQYKRLGGKPSVLCIGEGVQEIHRYFSQSDWSLKVGTRELSMEIDELDLNQAKVELAETPIAYELSNWIGLSQKSHQAYKKLDGLVERIEFLEEKTGGQSTEYGKGNWLERPQQN